VLLSHATVINFILIMNDLKRRAIAKGVKVGDLEEEQLLLDTIRASEIITRQQPTKSDVVGSTSLALISNLIPTALLNKEGRQDATSSSSMESKMSARGSTADLNDDVATDNDTMYDSSHGHGYAYPHNDGVDNAHNARSHGSCSDVALSTGGKWHRLPYEMVDYILMFLGDVDMMGYLLIASSHTFQPSEKVYEYLCSIIYLQQTSRKLLQVSKWGSWRRMLYHRPRLRTNGLYALRTQYTKEHNNDRFWEEKDHRSVEVRFYRCFRFMDHNRVLYSLDVMEVEDMAKLMQSGMARPKLVYEGHYSVQGREVVVDVSSEL